MNSKYRNYLLLGGSVLILLSTLAANLFGILPLSVSRSLKINCVSTLSMPVLPDGLTFNGSITVRLHANHTGEVDFSGILLKPQREGDKARQQWDVQRSIFFDYQMIDDHVVKLSNQKVNKKSVDSISDDVFSKSIYDNAEPEKRMWISRLNNGYLIGNMFSPSSLCVGKS